MYVPLYISFFFLDQHNNNQLSSLYQEQLIGCLNADYEKAYLKELPLYKGTI